MHKASLKQARNCFRGVATREEGTWGGCPLKKIKKNTEKCKSFDAIFANISLMTHFYTYHFSGRRCGLLGILRVIYKQANMTFKYPSVQLQYAYIAYCMAVD